MNKKILFIVTLIVTYTGLAFSQNKIRITIDGRSMSATLANNLAQAIIKALKSES